jgi:hypothetical protein
MEHKFRIGESVYFRPSERGVDARSGTYQVIAWLPGDGELRYQIRHAGDAHQRVVRESELRKS